MAELSLKDRVRKNKAAQEIAQVHNVDTEHLTMSDILHAATQPEQVDDPALPESLDQPRADSYAPVNLPKNTPPSGVEAYRNIKQHGTNLSGFIRDLGQKAVDDADAYNKRCLEFAKAIEDECEAEALRAAAFTTNIAGTADALINAMRNHKNSNS